jgi:hypothetical protein
MHGRAPGGPSCRRAVAEAPVAARGASPQARRATTLLSPDS